ncbi:MAG: ccdB [Sphingomonas bacterium]|nr:ccdB [Sphingomonas bacterium]
MARFDVFRERHDGGYLLDCQADILRGLDTRLTVPLFPHDEAPLPAGRLNPIFVIDGARFVMMTQYASAIRCALLGEPVGELGDEQAAIMNALDMLLTGY